MRNIIHTKQPIQLHYIQQQIEILHYHFIVKMFYRILLLQIVKIGKYIFIYLFVLFYSFIQIAAFVPEKKGKPGRIIIFDSTHTIEPLLCETFFNAETV